MKFSCTNCDQHIEADDSYAGLQVSCPTCGYGLVIPQPQPSSSHLQGATRLSWESWWQGFTNLYEEAKSQPSTLRHGLTVLRASEFAAQFYCEQQVDIRLLLRAERSRDWERRTSSANVQGRTDALAVGVRGHETIARNDPERPVEAIWRAVIDGESVRLHDPLLLGRYEEILLSGHPDVIIFSGQVPRACYAHCLKSEVSMRVRKASQ